MYGELYLAGPFEARNVIRKFADEADVESGMCDIVDRLQERNKTRCG